MKKKILFAIPLLSFFLTGCFLLPINRRSELSSEYESSSYSSESESEQSSILSSENTSSESESSNQESSSSSSSYSSENSNSESSSKSSSSESSSEKESSDYEEPSSFSEEESSYSEDSSEEEPSSEDFESSSEEQSEESSDASSESSEFPRYATIEIYSVNDAHGQVYAESGRAGLGAYATYFKEMKDTKENVLLIDQGDTWQGSIYSNYNHGQVFTDVMNYVQFDARAVGNHDFDWGADYIKMNTAKDWAGYSTPVLAGNVYDYDLDNKCVGDTQQSDLGVKSVTKVLDNGLKVGILGGIGQDQFTSISSVSTRKIAFIDHIDFIKEEAEHLRNDEHCDVVICAIHAGQGDVTGNNLKDYVDLVLCGHTHSQEYTNEGGLYFLQSKANTQSFGHVTLTFDRDVNDVTNTSIEYLSANTVANAISSIDTTIQDIIDDYYEDSKGPASDTIASNVSGTFYYGDSGGYCENLMARAILDTAIKEYPGVTVSCLNKARHQLSSGSWTYADLYEAFPFDNYVYIAEITGQEFLDEVVKYGYICKNSTFTTTTIDPNGTYTVAVIDYMFMHNNVNHEYDYFPDSAGTSTTLLSKTYREILRDWLIDNGYNTGKLLSSSNFSSSLNAHDKSVYTSL